MKFTNTQVMNFGNAFRGLRNPLESWSKSDSFFGLIDLNSDIDCIDNVVEAWIENELSLTELPQGQSPVEPNSKKWQHLDEEYFNWLTQVGIIHIEFQNSDIADVAFLGPKDLDLAQRMIRADSSDRKFLRQILVSVDITAPLYWWKEFDTYKVGTTANSTSTMHKLASTPITKDCFETGDFNDVIIEDNVDPTFVVTSGYVFDSYINWLEELRQKYNETKDKRYWKELIRLLPEAWLQTRTVTLNYEILRNIYSQRKHHRLSEWHTFCEWIVSLPYSIELILHNLD